MACDLGVDAVGALPTPRPDMHHKVGCRNPGLLYTAATQRCPWVSVHAVDRTVATGVKNKESPMKPMAKGG